MLSAFKFQKAQSKDDLLISQKSDDGEDNHDAFESPQAKLPILIFSTSRLMLVTSVILTFYSLLAIVVNFRYGDTVKYAGPSLIYSKFIHNRTVRLLLIRDSPGGQSYELSAVRAHTCLPRRVSQASALWRPITTA